MTIPKHELTRSEHSSVMHDFHVIEAMWGEKCIIERQEKKFGIKFVNRLENINRIIRSMVLEGKNDFEICRTIQKECPRMIPKMLHAIYVSTKKSMKDRV